jgi:hypothetical protein
MTIFIRVLGSSVDNKAADLIQAITNLRKPAGLEQGIYECQPITFSAVPGSPFAYWASEAVRRVFRRNARFDRDNLATRGAYTTDDFKYYRLCWEVPQVRRPRSRDDTFGAQAYVPLAKGGAFSPFYSDIHLAIRWHDDGAEPKVFLAMYRERKGWGTDWSACLNGYGHYFRPGLTWPRRTNGLSFRAMPAGCIFADKGPAAFVGRNQPDRLLSLCAVLNSRAFGHLVSVQLARTELAQSYEVGLIQQTPVPDLTDDDVTELAGLARRAWSLRRSLDTINETSHAFLLPHDLNVRVLGLDRAAIERELNAIQQEIDAIAVRLYGMSPEDRPAIDGATECSNSTVDASDDTKDEYADDAGEAEVAVSTLPDATICWLVGIAFGRFDPRLATGDRAIPIEPEPFDPLPSRSPGMYPEGDGPEDLPGLLVDDEGHTKDLTAHVQHWAERVSVEVCEGLRGWLAREFFPQHIKTYSKSRRKAPIYWQLATPSASYSVWLYIHAFSKDTLFRVHNDYVAGKLAHEERQLEILRAEAGPDPVTAQRKPIEAQEAFVEELRAFLDEVKRVAPLWNPNLDDGVIINFAPLWRLVPQHKPWQKELKSTWDALCAGKYDWAHLAMHLWPERVVPKCVEDRSLAIAHDLEDVFWYQDEHEKWKPREEPTTPIDALVNERTSSAVKAALKSLVEAPEQSGGARRGRGRRT